MENALSIIRSGNAICEQVVRGKDIVSVGRKVFASGGGNDDCYPCAKNKAESEFRSISAGFDETF